MQLVLFDSLGCGTDVPVELLAWQVMQADRVGLWGGFRCSASGSKWPLWPYDEWHGDAMAGRVAGVDDILVPWHLENPNWFFPQLAAGWWMDKVRCPEGAGRTAFVDGESLWRRLPPALRRAAEFHHVTWFDVPDKTPVGGRVAGDEIAGRYPIIFECESGGSELLWAHAAVQQHPCRFRDYPVLRVYPSIPVFDEANVVVCTFDGKQVFPGSSGWDDMVAVANWVRAATWFDSEGLVEWLDWEERQFRIVDLFAGYHAVSGGFKMGDRHLTGFWGYEPWCTDDPRLPPKDVYPLFHEGVV